MNFDLTQLLKQSPIRDLVLNQVAKQFGLSSDTSSSLLNKGLSMILGGMTQKASSADGASKLFDLIKNFNLQGNPLDLITGKTSADNSNFIESGKNILGSLFGDRAESISSHLAESTKTDSNTAKGFLAMLLPVVFSFFKNKIASGLGVAGFTKLLGEQTKAFASNLDTQSLSALGFTNRSLNDVVASVEKVGAGMAGATATAAATKANEAKSSGLGKWLIAGGVILAALLGLRNCSGDKADSATAQQPAQPAQAEQKAEASTPATPAEIVKTTDGLGDLSWAKGDNDFTVSGTVQNEETKASILDAFKGLAGNLPLVDKLTVDANAEKSNFANFAGLADLFKGFPNVNGAFADKALNLVGSVDSEQAKADLASKAKALLGDLFSVNTDGVNLAKVAEKVTDGLGNLGWLKTDKDFTVSGTVQNEDAKASILDAFKGLAGNLPLVDKLAVDTNTEKFNFGNFAGLADLAKAFPNVNGSFADKIFNLFGQVENADAKTALVDQAKSLLGDVFSVNADGVTVVQAQQAPAAEEEAAEIADMTLAKLNLDIVFDTGSANVSPRYFRRLDALAKFLIENNRGGEIAGYTDNVGNAASNQKLSEQRANAVREYLVKAGVPAEKLTAVGYGEQDPIADNNTAEGRHQNRRIEFNAR